MTGAGGKGGRRAAGRRAAGRAAREPGGPAAIGDFAQAALKGMAGEERTGLIEVLSVWEQAVGETVSRAARPARFSRGILTLAVTSPVWSQQLVLMRAELLAALNSHLGRDMVVDLRFSPSRRDREGSP